MPDDESSYVQRFEYDVQDSLAKADQLIRKNNEIAESVKRIKEASKHSLADPGAAAFAKTLFGGRRGSELQEAQRELAATLKFAKGKEAEPYWADAIKKQRAVVENLKNKDQQDDLKRIEEEKKKRLDAEKEIEREASAWQKHTNAVARQERQRESQEKKKLRDQEKQHRGEERQHAQELSNLKSVVGRGLSAVGLGGLAPAVGGALDIGSKLMNKAVVGSMSVPLMGAMAAGATTLGGVFHAMKSASDTITGKTPGWADFAERAQHTMPETALERTEAARAAKLGYRTTKSAVAEMLSGVFDLGLKGLKAAHRSGILSGGALSGAAHLLEGWTEGGEQQAEAQQREWEMQRQLETKQATRELRLRSLGRMMGGVEGSMQLGAQDEMSRMGYYATQGQAYQSNEFKQMNQDMIDTMKKLVEVMEGKGTDSAKKQLIDVFGWRGK